MKLLEYDFSRYRKDIRAKKEENKGKDRTDGDLESHDEKRGRTEGRSVCKNSLLETERGKNSEDRDL